MISANDMMDYLLSKELKQKVSVSEDVSGSSLFTGGRRTSDRGGGYRRKSCSESRASNKIRRYNYKEKGHYRRYFPPLKKGNHEFEISSNNNVVVVQDSSDELEVLVLCATSFVDA